MVETDPHRQAAWISGVDRGEAFLESRPLHGKHGVGENEHIEPAHQRVVQQLEHVWVHERLAAGKPDLGCAQRQSFVEKWNRFCWRDVGESVVSWARFDITILARDVAQRAGIDPKRRELIQRHAGAAFALGGPIWVFELGGRPNWRFDFSVEGHDCSLSAPRGAFR